MIYWFNGFMVQHDGGTVIVSKANVPPSQFDAELYTAQRILAAFPSRLHNVWGCDGVGYTVQRNRGEVRVCLSTVGPRQFRKGWLALTGTVPA